MRPGARAYAHGYAYTHTGAHAYARTVPHHLVRGAGWELAPVGIHRPFWRPPRVRFRSTPGCCLRTGFSYAGGTGWNSSPDEPYDGTLRRAHAGIRQHVLGFHHQAGHGHGRLPGSVARSQITPIHCDEAMYRQLGMLPTVDRGRRVSNPPLRFGNSRHTQNGMV